MKKSILFVDDEAHVLDGLQRMLRTKRDEWDMHFARNGSEALAIVKSGHIDVIVSDMRMPGMDGNQLLSAVMQCSPDTIRFVLSGHADQESIYKAIGTTHQYMAKPNNAESMINTIERAFAIRDILKKDSLKQLVTHIRMIPSLPDLYLQVVNELRSPNASTHKVGQIIAQDIGMSAKVLQLVNSAFFGLRRHIAEPAQAAALLGLDVLKSLVLMAQVFSQVEKSFPAGYSLQILWTHSLAVAHSARTIAKNNQVDKKSVDDAFMSGLFHDLGKLVLIVNMPEQYGQVLHLIQDAKKEQTEAEREVFGGTHEEVGAYLLGLWGFADPVMESASFHHRPSTNIGTEFCSLTAVHVANVFVNEFEAAGKKPSLTALDVAYLERIGCADQIEAWHDLCMAVCNQGAKSNEEDSLRG